MKLKKCMSLLVTMICIVGGTVYAWDSISNAINARPIQEDNVLVYDDGEWTATIPKEEYDTLSESDKANFDNTYKKIIEIIEKNEND